MNSNIKRASETPLEMANEAFYKNQADSYRSSSEYNKMLQLYPILKNTIGECKNENFIS